MRFNVKEVSKISEGNAELEGVLCYMKPQENDWSDWYQRQSFKERLFKLISNLLFYYRINEPNPVGVIVLENCDVSSERPFKGFPYTFTINFRISSAQNVEQKHIFFCRSHAEVEQWVSRLKVASYEHWRSQLTILKTKISMRTGKDPVLDYLKKQQSEKECRTKNSDNEKSICAQRSTFQSHIEMRSECESTAREIGLFELSLASSSEITATTSDIIPVGNLLDI